MTAPAPVSDPAAGSPRVGRLPIIQAALAAFALAIVGRAAHVQLIESDGWRARAERQHVADASLPAPRGLITDVAGRVLVESRELVRLRVAPREVRDRARLRRLLLAAGVPRPWAARAVDTTRAWVELPGRYLPSDVGALAVTRGVHAEPVVERVLSTSPAVARVVGHVDADGRAVDGIELALDSLLQGTRGTRTLFRDARGARVESPAARTVPATPGHHVALTLHWQLQDICERALAGAVESVGATGGDIVVLEPHRGEVLAMASQRADPRATAATAISEPFEPGSTIKPFVAAALLSRARLRLNETVNTEHGVWTTHGRTIRDVHVAASMSVGDVIRHSSNIGIVKLAERLTPREQYEALRDLGFGTATGVPYPAEASGTLRPPKDWTPQSAASLAMGYELAATPLQLAAAYGAIANGGMLLEPALVREIRAPDGTVRWRHAARPVRRVMSPDVAATVRAMLQSVVDSGTATGADLASFAVGGKSGTVRRIERGRGYAAGRYNAVFAGLFPVQDPQFVIVVKLENPSGVYYGGKIAAPVTKVVLEAALAARDAALDRGALERGRSAVARDAWSPRDSGRAAFAAAQDAKEGAPPAGDTTRPSGVAPELRRELPVDAGARPIEGAVRAVVALPARPATTAHAPRPPRPVPAVQGLPLRDAVYALHRAGFRVRLDAVRGLGSGRSAGATVPAAGTSAAAGTLVTLSPIR